jgi:hypothetical protein
MENFINAWFIQDLTICDKIIKGETVDLSEMIWAEKLAKANRSASTMLRQARRKAENPNMTEDSMDGFLNALDIGGLGHESKGISNFDTIDDIVNFFTEEKPDDWRTRD